MFKTKDTKRLAAELHAEVWGTLDMRLNDTSKYDGYEVDAVRMYEQLVKDLIGGNE